MKQKLAAVVESYQGINTKMKRTRYGQVAALLVIVAVFTVQ